MTWYFTIVQICNTFRPIMAVRIHVTTTGCTSSEFVGTATPRQLLWGTDSIWGLMLTSSVFYQFGTCLLKYVLYLSHHLQILSFISNFHVQPITK